MATETDTVLASRSNGNDKEMEKRNVKDEDVASEKKDGSLHSPCDGSSLDELFFQNAVRKPPPKTNRYLLFTFAGKQGSTFYSYWR